MSFPVENYGTLQMRGIVSITDAESSFRFIMQLALILFPLLIIFSAIAGYLMSRRALSPVEKITQTVRNIQQGKRPEPPCPPEARQRRDLHLGRNLRLHA